MRTIVMEPVDTHPYPRFLAALLMLGETDAERAARLNVHRHTIRMWRSGRVAPQLVNLATCPELLMALGEDLAHATQRAA